MQRFSYYKSMAIGLCWAVILVAIQSPLSAQDFPEIYNSEPDSKAAPMDPESAAKKIEVPAGFKASVFASEPDVQNPIDMTWDAKGRIWIAENYTYAERKQRFDLNLRDRVTILQDSNHDGKADKRTVFTDQVQMLTSVEVGQGGVWLMCPPNLLFIPDENLDDKPDGPPQIVLDGFEVAQDNYHNFANGLRWGPDGWLYGRCGGSCPGKIGKPGTTEGDRIPINGGMWRYHPRTQKAEVITHGTTNPWGHDWNEMGEGFFINTVNGHLWHLIPGAHFVRPFTLDPNPHVFEFIDMHADHWHFDTGKGWTKSRDGSASSYGGGHAHTGMMIYNGDNWPKEYRQRLFTWNIHGQRANQEILERHGSGYVAKHGKDLFQAGDPFFRGMELSYGPDGAVYAADWSDTGECHEHSGVHRNSGRIFKIEYIEKTAAKSKTEGATDLREFTSAKLIELLKHENEWFVRQARLILTERSQGVAKSSTTHPIETSDIESLKAMVEGSDPKIAYRALTTLHAMNSMKRQFLTMQLSHKNEHLRVWAVRLLTDDWILDDVNSVRHQSVAEEKATRLQSDQLVDRFCVMAETDKSSMVRLVLASTLQKMPMAHRLKLARSLMNNMEDAEDHNLPMMVWYGLIPTANTHAIELARVAVESTWPKTQRYAVRRVAGKIDVHPQALDLVVAALSKKNPKTRLNLVEGISDGLQGWRKAPKPKNWDQFVQFVGRESSANDPRMIGLVRELSVLFGDGIALAQVRKLVLDPKQEIGVRRSALETLVRSSSEDIEDICIGVLGHTNLNVAAAQGLAKSNNERSAKAMVRNYRRFRSPQRPKVISILASRAIFANVLLDAVEQRKIPADHLTAYDIRQMRLLADENLQRRITELWGEVRESSKEKLARIKQVREIFAQADLKQVDLSQGRQLFNKSCAKCHKLFGHGESIGPDLTGGDRKNIDYLLENILDPSAVVSKDFKMSILELENGQTLSGLIVAKDKKTLRLQTQTELKTLAIDEVANIDATDQSPMPDGLLDELTKSQIQNLLLYLQQPGQIPLENSEPEQE